MLNPDQPDALKTLAAIDLAGGDGQSGLHLLKRAAKLDPADFRPWYAMGKVHHDLGDLHASSSAYSKALALQPPRAEKRASQVGLTRALIDLNDDQRAAAALAPALAETPRDPELLTLDARLAWLRGDTDRALASAKRALEQTPDDFDALLVRAQVMNSRGALEIALADLAHASKLNRNHLGALQLLAQVQTRLGRAEDAAYTQTRLTEARDRVAEMDKLTREISARPDDPTPRYRMGRVALESGINTLALQCFRAALDLDPSFGPAREALESMRSQERANSTHGSGSALP
jgi:tetratricopeptide (TPR) repeat protein